MAPSIFGALPGVGPMRFQSGKLDQAHLRWACDGALRHTVHLWADRSRKRALLTNHDCQS